MIRRDYKGRFRSCPPTQVDEIRQLAAEGVRATEIARITGCAPRTALKYTRDILGPYEPPPADLGRLRRIVAAADNADIGDGPDLARRFNLSCASSFWGVVNYARKRLASAEQRRAA